ncbi:hypothetical protein ACFUAG_34775, partial [Streptomyces sp. NPDC057193]|uniref:hypothetical protein n=1 Tax=Streptomyces sp. NPDC057193 TaxID=3346043 RepID=UPI003644F993
MAGGTGNTNAHQVINPDERDPASNGRVKITWSPGRAAWRPCWADVPTWRVGWCVVAGFRRLISLGGAPCPPELAHEAGEALGCCMRTVLEVLTKALDVSVGDEARGEAEEGFVYVVASF